MRSSFLRTACLGLALALMAAPGKGATQSPPDAAPLRLTAGRPLFVPAEDGHGVVPRIEGFGLSSRPGEPLLPLRVLLVAIPEGSIPELQILAVKSETLAGLDLAPVPAVRVRDRVEKPRGAVRRKERRPESTGAGSPDGRSAGAPPDGDLLEYDEDYTPDAAIYGHDAEFPAAPVRLGSVGYLRAQRFVEVIYTPILYNPGRRHARFFSEVEAEVRFGGAALGLPDQPAPADPFFEETYRKSLVNYEQGRLFRAASPGGVSPETASTTMSAASTSLQAAAGGARYKLLVSKSGIYRLSYAYLSTNAPEMVAAGVDPRTLVLTAEGVEVPISIREATGASGEADGRFDAGDFLEFFGRPKSEPPTRENFNQGSAAASIYQANDFTDTQVYWLSAGGTVGAQRRIPQVSGAQFSAGFAIAADFQETAVWEENNIYIPVGDADPFFSMPSLLAGGTQAQRDLSLALPGIAPGTWSASVVFQMRGGSDLIGIAPDHRARIWLNADTGGGAELLWDGETLATSQAFSEARGFLTNPVTIHLSAPGLAGVSVDRQYPSFVSVGYRRNFNALSDVLSFTYPNQDARFQVTGFTGASPTIYDVSRNLAGGNEADPILITNATVGGSTSFSYTFDAPRDASASAPPVRAFHVAGPNGLRLQPDAIVRAADPVLQDPANAADIVVIASRDTVDATPSGATPGSALEALLAHRWRTQRLTSKIVFVDQIYDEFSYGLRDVNALRTFLDYAFNNWKGADGLARPLSFVLLVGDATPDYKDTLNRPDWYIDQVPTPMMLTMNSIIGYYSSDNWIASFRGGDQVPDVHLGRISTRTAAASEAVFDKIRRYEESPPPGDWKGRGILVASDGADSNEAAGFEAVQDDLAATYFAAAPYSAPSPPLYFNRAPWNGTDTTLFKNDLITALNGGAAILSYIGHGGFDVWGRNTVFFSSDDADRLRNGPLPFLVTVNCLTGGFHYFLPTGSLGEEMVNNSLGGAIASLAPSGLANVIVGQTVRDFLFDTVLGPRKERLIGAAADNLRLGFWSRGSVIDVQGYSLLGDPATVLPIPAPPPPTGLTASAGNAEVRLAWSAPSTPVAAYRIYRAGPVAAGTNVSTLCNLETSASCARYAPVACDPVTATSCVDRSVANASSYYYYASSLDGDGFIGAASNFNTDCDGGPDCVSARPLNPGPPAVPKGLTSSDPGTGGRLQVFWQANSETDLKGYNLYYGTQPGGPYAAKVSLGKDATSTLLAGLTDGVAYYMALSATNTSGNESLKSAETFNVPHLIQGISPPRAISDLTLNVAGNDLVLTWSRPTVDIYGRATTVVQYNVYRGPTPGFLPFMTPPLVVIAGGSTTTFIDPGAALAATGDAYYLVTATDLN
ncbi:MAG TPA: C25 family cysteine peptidase, partial [Candidatus Polarisedimenticolia bacterium]|nr:C25 family cysteine peptidase [Candidatus Polarisedimenticolia bacterium]